MNVNLPCCSLSAFCLSFLLEYNSSMWPAAACCQVKESSFVLLHCCCLLACLVPTDAFNPIWLSKFSALLFQSGKSRPRWVKLSQAKSVLCSVKAHIGTCIWFVAAISFTAALQYLAPWFLIVFCFFFYASHTIRGKVVAVWRALYVLGPSMTGNSFSAVCG